MILQRIRAAAKPATQIPKPQSTDIYTVVGWGQSRGEKALVYRLPTKSGTKKASEKRITESAFVAGFEVLQKSGELTREWFKRNFPALERDGGCNFTTLGGILELIGEAQYAGPGVYKKTKTAG